PVPRRVLQRAEPDLDGEPARRRVAGCALHGGGAQVKSEDLPGPQPGGLECQDPAAGADVEDAPPLGQPAGPEHAAQQPGVLLRCVDTVGHLQGNGAAQWCGHLASGRIAGEATSQSRPPRCRNRTARPSRAGGVARLTAPYRDYCQYSPPGVSPPPTSVQVRTVPSGPATAMPSCEQGPPGLACPGPASAPPAGCHIGPTVGSSVQNSAEPSSAWAT